VHVKRAKTGLGLGELAMCVHVRQINILS